LVLLYASWAVSPGEFFCNGFAAHCALPDIPKPAVACRPHPRWAVSIMMLDSKFFAALQQEMAQRTIYLIYLKLFGFSKRPKPSFVTS
jgi:hypothetical protein